MYKYILSILTFAVLAISGMQAEDTANFITIKYGRFTDGDKPWYANGGNCTYDGRLNRWSNNDIETWFRIASECNMTAVRIFACGEGVNENDSIRENGRVYQKGGAGNWYEPAFRSTDYALYCARKYNVRILFCLLTHTQGSQTYSAWAGIDEGNFWSNATCKQWYKNYVNHFLNRVNTYTGVKYMDDPYIFGWEPGNEVDLSSDSKGNAVSRGTLDSWLWEMAAYIKSIDVNHLVGSGIQGGYELRTNSNSATSKWKVSHNNSAIDFCSFHNYPLEANPNQTRNECEPIMLNAVKFSRELNKPVLMGEFGASDKSTSSKGYTTTAKKEMWWNFFANYTSGFQMGGQMFWCWYKPGTDNGGSGVNPQTEAHAGLREITANLGNTLSQMSTEPVLYDSRPQAITNLRAAVSNSAHTVTFTWNQPAYSNGQIPDENYPLTYELRYDNMDDYQDVVSNLVTKNREGYTFGEMRYVKYFTLAKGVNSIEFTDELISDGIIPNEYYLRFRDSRENVWSELSNKLYVTSTFVAPTAVETVTAAGYKIHVQNNKLWVNAAKQPVECQVFDITGKLLHISPNSHDHSIELSRKGVLIITLRNNIISNSYKIINY